MLISGQCQCGNLSFILEWLAEPTEIPARACGCSFCTTHRGVWTSSPSAKLKVHIKNPELVDRHTFATGTAEFHICRQCADVPLVTSLIDGRLFAVVNVHALQAVSPGLFKHSHANFEGESLDAKIERRRLAWIADVSMSDMPD